MNCSYSWTKFAGHANCSAYDLANHVEKSGNQLTTREVLPRYRDMEVFGISSNQRSTWSLCYEECAGRYEGYG